MCVRGSGVDGVARRWRLNPPPNWPTLPDGWEPDRDWSPDPAWGPAPVGWTLWRRERRAVWLMRHRRSAGVGSAAALTLFVALAGPPSSGTLTEAAPADRDGAPPAAGALLVPRTPPDQPRAEPVIKLERRLPSASRGRRPGPWAAATGMPVPSASIERVPERRSPNGTATEGSGSGTGSCRTPAPAPGDPQAPRPSFGSDRIITVGYSKGRCPSAVRQPGALPSPTDSGSPEPSG
jgi:hypothetical protein